MERKMDDYIFYKRKSSDSEDKQILSLESQNRVIQETIPHFEKFKIISDYQESMSAKAPGRPKFNKMCEQLEKGEAKKIICWQLNRLARNPVDGGRIIWLVQNYGIEIITPSKTYGAEDILLMYVEFAMSNQFITDLRKSTMRGTEDKHRAGKAPLKAPIGYYNDKYKPQGLRDILVDDERFILIRKTWDTLFTRQYSVRKIWQIATNEWGLRQRNGRPISRSKFYEIYTNIFYTGKYLYNGQIYQGIHTPMVTMDEFDMAQRILGQKGKPRSISRDFAFTNIIKCTCDSYVTAEERYRKVCQNCRKKFNAEKNEYCPQCKTIAPDKTEYYCHYHCSRKKDNSCAQPHIPLKNLETQIDSILESIELPQEFIDWTMDKLRRFNDEEASSRTNIQDSLQSSIKNINTKLDNLLAKYLTDQNRNGDIISDELYLELKNKLITEKEVLTKQLSGEDNRQEQWMETAEKVFNFSKNARYWFKNGSKIQKRVILLAIGSDLVLENGLLRCNLLKPFNAIKQLSEVLNQETNKFGPDEKVVTKRKTGTFEYENPLLYRVGDSNP